MSSHQLALIFVLYFNTLLIAIPIVLAYSHARLRVCEFKGNNSVVMTQLVQQQC